MRCRIGRYFKREASEGESQKGVKGVRAERQQKPYHIKKKASRVELEGPKRYEGPKTR
jgi:hypothetical protein